MFLQKWRKIRMVQKTRILLNTLAQGRNAIAQKNHAKVAEAITIKHYFCFV